MRTTAELLRQFDGPIRDESGSVVAERKHSIKPNTFKLTLRVDDIDTTPSPVPENRHRCYSPGDLHAAVVIPIPVWLYRVLTDPMGMVRRG